MKASRESIDSDLCRNDKSAQLTFSTYLEEMSNELNSTRKSNGCGDQTSNLAKLKSQINQLISQRRGATPSVNPRDSLFKTGGSASRLDQAKLPQF